MFAGSFQGITQTVPLAIYDRFSTDFDSRARAIRGARRGVRRDPPLGEARARQRGARRLQACFALRRAPASARSSSTSALEVARGRVPRARRASRAPARPACCAWRRACCGPSTAGSRRRRDLARHGARDRRARPTSAAAATSSRSTRSSRTSARGRTSPTRCAEPRRAAARARARAARALRPRRARRRASADALGRRAPARGAGTRARPRPEVLLLDEPLSALDARTRASAARELAAVLREIDVPALLVTHDFSEAAQLGDRVGDHRRRAGSCRRAPERAGGGAALGVRGRLHRRGRAHRRRAGGARTASPTSSSTAAARSRAPTAARAPSP